MLKLVISDDEGKTTVVPLVRDEITIGRKEGNTIRLTERNVSRKHAKLRKVNGGFLVEDLGSYNGIRVNGRKIEKESALQAGDQIGIGDYLLALQEEAAAAAEAANAAAAAAAAAPPPPPVVATLGTETPTSISAPPVMPVSDTPTAMVAAPPVDAGPPARLVMISPPAPGAEFALSRPRMRVGRAEDLDICVTHKSISREHVELTNDAGGLRVRDLGSANGVRINGRDVSEALAAPGDVIELGQVRFKYVGAGTAYTFDEGRTVQMDAAVAPAKSRMPLYVAIGIIAIALIGTIAFVAASGGDHDTTTVAPGQTTGPGTGPVTTGPNGVGTGPNVASAADLAYTQALAGCQTALSSGAWAQALVAAQQALTVRPGDAQAAECQARATAGVNQQAHFDTGLSQYRQGNFLEAMGEFEQLPADSPLRQRPEVPDALRRYARQQLDQAQPLVHTNAPEANRLARSVLTMSNVPPDLAQEAHDIISATQPVAVVHVPPHGNNNPPHGNDNPPHGGNNPPPGGGNNPPPGGNNNPPPGGDDASRLVRARACAINGDNPCVIRELSGARSQAEMDMLIQAYRDSGNLNAALPVMRRYVERFPSSPRANGYRQILNLHPGN